MNIHKLDAHKIATQCFPVHIENVILDLLELLKMAERLAKELDTLNVYSSQSPRPKGRSLESKDNELGFTRKLMI